MKLKPPILFRFSRPGEKWPGIRPSHPIGWVLYLAVIFGFVALALDVFGVWDIIPTELRMYALVGILLLNLLNVALLTERPRKDDRQ